MDIIEVTDREQYATSLMDLVDTVLEAKTSYNAFNLKHVKEHGYMLESAFHSYTDYRDIITQSKVIIQLGKIKVEALVSFVSVSPFGMYKYALADFKKAGDE